MDILRGCRRAPLDGDSSQRSVMLSLDGNGLSFNRLVVDLRFLVGRFELHDDGAESVVAAHDGDARLLDPVAVVEERLVRAVRQRILLTHGHTPDSVTYHLPSENCAFVGDSIIDGNVGLTKFPGGDQPTLIRSLETRILTLPADTTLLSGHSAPLTLREFLT